MPIILKVGRSPLHIAAQSNHLDVLKTLITPGFDWTSSALDSLGCTPLHLAAIHGHLDVIKFLLKENCPVNYQNQFGNTALHECCYRGHAKVAKYLIQKKGDKSIQNQDGNQCLHLACQGGHLDVIKTLLKNAADPNAKNLSGDSCVHICVRYNQLSAYRFLIANNSNCRLEDVNSERNTPLHLAVQYNRKEFALALLEVGIAAAAIKNQQGETPLDIANRLGHDDLFTPATASSTLFLPTSHLNPPQINTCSNQSNSVNTPDVNNKSNSDQQQSKQTSNETPQPPSGSTSGATSGMKNLFRAATGRTSSSGATGRKQLQSNNANGGQDVLTAGCKDTSANGAQGQGNVDASVYDAAKTARSRSRGASQPKQPASPSRKRDISSGNPLEHENSPAADMTQELSVEIDDDATKPPLGAVGTSSSAAPPDAMVPPDDQGIVIDDNGELRDTSELDMLKRHQRRSHKSKGKVPRKYNYDRGMSRRSKRFGASLSSLSTLDHHHHHHHHHHKTTTDNKGEGGGGRGAPGTSHHHDVTSSVRHHHYHRGSSGQAGGGGGGLYTLYDGAYLTKPAKETSGGGGGGCAPPDQQQMSKRRHRANKTAANLEQENEYSTADHRQQQLSSSAVKCRCGCSKHIAALDAKVEFLKEAILDELKLSEEVTDKKIVDLDEKTTHQVACVDKLCRERISAERTECNHRMDRRALQERIVYSKELRKLELRMESTMKAWCEARYRRVNERIGSQMNFYPTLSSAASPSGANHKRRHSCSDVDPRNLSVAANSQDESGAETTNSSKSGYRDSGAFESNSKASSQDYQVATTSGGESLGTTPSESGPVTFGAPSRAKNMSSSFVGGDSSHHIFGGFLPIDERPGASVGRYPTVFHNPSDDAESVIDNESVSQLPVLHGLPSDSIKPNDFASLAIPPLLTKDVRVISDNKRSISAHSDEAKMASEEIMTQIQQNYGSIHYKDSSRTSSHTIRGPGYFRTASTSVSGSHHPKMSLSPLTQQRSQTRFSSVSGVGLQSGGTPSYQEVSAQLKAIQQQAARSKTVRNSSLSDEKRSHDSSGSATGSVHDGKTGGANDPTLGFQTPVGSWDEKTTRQMNEIEASMKKHYEKDQQALKQRIRTLEQMLKSYQSPSEKSQPESHQTSQAEH
ncbi:uncharacterized protein LOC142354424 isoform X3 [Convolutriloba macropyga]|uniref:uncharacterized protein LOC142354424 isoform X3 n=1 Tax=Convolutriloba macropyga TaxID=536237 RepID=UPI003F5237C0